MKLKSFLWPLNIFLGYTVFGSSNWIVRKFGKVTYEQIMFHLNMPFASERKLVFSFIQNTFLPAFILILLMMLFFYISKKMSKKGQWIDVIYKKRFLFSCFFLIFGIIWAFFKMNCFQMIQYSQYKFKTSSFYEENYIKPETVKINFPIKKQNLILIFAESMESSYIKTEEHNYFGHNLIPELTTLAQKNTNFSHNNEIGGAYPIDGTQWTQAGLFAQTCGIPIQLPIQNPNWFHPKDGFFPKAYCLYDILNQQGYQESFLIGSAGTFASMDQFVKTHKNQRLLDVDYFAEKEGFSVSFKGTTKLSDKKVFQYAKEELNNLSSQKKPFVFTVMTLDTHYGTHHFEESECERKYGPEKNIENVVSCSDKQIGHFIKWIQKQPFYKNTTVVIVGDHLTMNNRFTDSMDRKPINIFMNALPKSKKTRNRIFTPFDLYPTIIESMGGKIEGHRLGLGTSLYADIPTLTEDKISIQEMDIEVRKKSKLYDELLYGKDVYHK